MKKQYLIIFAVAAAVIVALYLYRKMREKEKAAQAAQAGQAQGSPTANIDAADQNKALPADVSTIPNILEPSGSNPTGSRTLEPSTLDEME